MANTGGKQIKSGSSGSVTARNIAPSSGKSKFSVGTSSSTQSGKNTAGSSSSKAGSNSSNSFAAYRNGSVEAVNPKRKTMRERMSDLFKKDEEEEKKAAEQKQQTPQRPNTRAERARQAREEEMGLRSPSGQKTGNTSGQGKNQDRMKDATEEANARQTQFEGRSRGQAGRNYLAETVEQKPAQQTQQKPQAKQTQEAQQKKSSAERDALLKQYNQAVEAERQAIGYATDELSAQEANRLTARRIDLEEQLRALNTSLGNNEYADLADEAKGRAGIKSFFKEREALAGAAIGTGMQWLDSTSNDMVRYEYDQEHGEGAWDRLMQERPELRQSFFGDAGEKLFEGSKGMMADAQEQWGNATTDMSRGGRMVADAVKSGANAGLDMIDNQLLPGLGTMHMILRTGGGGALQQDERENNDIDTRMRKLVFDSAAAWLSTKALGGMEAVYGKSVLGNVLNQAVGDLSKPVQYGLKAVLNTEGLEEGLEYCLGYLGDKYLGFDQQAEFNRGELWQNVAVGYALGVVFKGVEAGLDYDAKSLKAVADEAAEFADSGLTIEEAERIALSQPNEDVKIEAGKQKVDQNAGSWYNTDAQQMVPAEQTGARRATAPAAGAEPYTGPQLPGAQYGGSASVKIGGERVPTHYAVVPISDIIPSHDIYGNQNKNFPSELQPRDRSRDTSKAQAYSIGMNLDPGELEWSNNGTTGAPIIRSDGVVISGNGRTIGIDYAIRNGKAEAYTEYLRDNAERFGLDPNSIGPDSVLVRVVDGEGHDWQSLAKAANVSSVGKMSASEQARIDAESMAQVPDLMRLLTADANDDLNLSDNQEFIKRFLQEVVPEPEQNSVWTEEGGLSKEGLIRVQNAIFEAAYGDASLLKRLSESTDDNMKNVTKAMLAAAPGLAKLEYNVADGTRRIGMRDSIVEGVKILEAARSKGEKVEKYISQLSVEDNPSAIGVYIAKFLENNTRSSKEMRRLFSKIVIAADGRGDPTQFGFFDSGEEEVTPRDVMDEALEAYEREYNEEHNKEPDIQIGRPEYDVYGDGGLLPGLEADRGSESGSGEEPNAGDAGAAGRTGNGDGGERAGENGSTANPVDLLLDEGRATEPQNEPVTNPAPQEAEIPPTGQESNTEGLTAPETKAEPEAAAEAETEAPQAEENQTQGPAPRPAQTTEEAQQDRTQKLSQFFSNTLTESARTEGLDPLKYDPKPEVESLTNAINRMRDDYNGLVDELMRHTAWDGEMVDAAWAIENEIYKQYLKTGDRYAWDAWRKIEDQKIRETARGLQAVAKQSRPGAAGVLNAILKEIDAARQANAVAKAEGRTADVIPEETLTKAEQQANDIAQRMGNLELGIDERVEQGMSREEALESVKKQYLDLADEIVALRHTGLMQDAGKNAKIRKAVKDVQTKFRKMLGQQDMEYIQRYVACQAAGIAEDIHYQGDQDFLKRLNTFQKLAQLTGTGTWGRNLVGNASFGLIDILSSNNPVTLVADAILGRKTGKRSQGFEWGVLSKSARQEARQNLQRSILEVAGNIDLATDQDQTKYDMARTRTYDPDGNAMERVLSRWEQWNGYMLQSSDAWFKGLAEGSFRNSVIRANGWDRNNLTKQQKAELDEAARMVSEYRTFQNKGLTAQAANGLRDGLNKLFNKNWKPGQFGVGTALMPYTTVPSNIGVKALEFSPAGAVKGLAEMIRVGKDAKVGKATMAQQNQAVTDFGRGVTGTALIVGLASLMQNAPWFKDWEEEEDKDVKAQNKAEGKSGMQLNVDMMLSHILDGDDDPTWLNGDRTVDISSIEPLNQLITAASLLSEGKNFGEAVLRSAKDSFMSLPSVQALQNIENTIKYTDTPDDLKQTLLNTAASTAGGIVGGFIPAPLRHASAAADEYQRDTSGSNAAERAWNQIVSATPWRQSLPVKTDAYGNAISNGDLETRLKNQYLPNKYSQVNQSDVSREVERLREETGIDLTPDRTGPKSQSFGKGENKQQVKLDNDDSRAWKNANGQVFEELMQAAMDSEVYRNAGEDQAELGSLLKEVAKDTVKGDFADYYGLPHESDYDEVRQLDDPVNYLLTKKEFSLAEKDGNWDAVDELMPALGSMSESDKEYSRDKNSTLWSYYDFLTPNEYGFAADSAEAVHDYKSGAKARAEERGVSSASSIDKVSELRDGLRRGVYSTDDADAFMTKQQSDGDWDASKGRMTIYMAIREATIKQYGPSGWTPYAAAEALQAAIDADKNGNGLVQWKYTQKAEYEVSNAIQNQGFQGAAYNAAMDYFNEIYGRKK